MRIENSVSSCLLSLMLEFNKCNGVFEPQKAVTFLAMLSECFEEVGWIEVNRRAVPLRFPANDNNCEPHFDGGTA